MTETDQIAEAGVHLVGLRVTTKLKWIYRPQPISDQGIDAHIEVAENGRGNGAVLPPVFRSILCARARNFESPCGGV